MNQVDTEALRHQADRFEDDVAAKIAAALNDLQGAQAIAYSNFTTVHIPLALVYTEAWNFQNRDLQTKKETAGQFAKNLDSTADDWDAAEDKSTMSTYGPH